MPKSSASKAVERRKQARLKHNKRPWVLKKKDDYEWYGSVGHNLLYALYHATKECDKQLKNGAFDKCPVDDPDCLRVLRKASDAFHSYMSSFESFESDQEKEEKLDDYYYQKRGFIMRIGWSFKVAFI